MRMSLVSHWFVWLCEAFSVLVMLFATGWRDRHWRYRVAAWVVLSAGLVLLLRGWVDGWSIAQPALPLSTWVWPWQLVFVVGVGVAGFKRASMHQRVAAPVAMFGAMLAIAVSYNAYFAYYPTLESLVRPVTGPTMSDSQIRRARVATYEVATPLPPHGVTVPFDAVGTLSGFNGRGGFVYLPPAWFGPDRARLPVVMLLAGTPGTTADWLRAGYANLTADAYASSHNGWAPVIVMPDNNGSFRGDTECVDGPLGRVDTYLDRDVRVAVESKFGVGRARRWMVAGDSEGGTCALMLGMRHPGDFAAVGDFGGNTRPTLGSRSQTLRTLYGGSSIAMRQDDPRWIINHDPPTTVRIWIEVGADDHGIYWDNRRLVNELRAAGVPATWQSIPGGHTFWVWSASFRQWLPWAMRGQPDAPRADHGQTRDAIQPVGHA